MGGKKVVILSRSYGMATSVPTDYLRQKGFEIIISHNSEPENVELIAEKIGDADAIITGSDVINKYVLDHCPNLKLISKHGVGLDSIDLEEVASRGVNVRITPDANNESVADLTILLMLAVLRNFKNNLITTASPDWKTYSLSFDLQGKTVGLIGFGKIGRAVANRLMGFNCKLLVCDPVSSQEDLEAFGANLVSQDEVLALSDIVSLHLPLLASTKHLINEITLSQMKSGAILINTSRGALVDEKALYNALKNKKLYGAASDVYSVEPPVNEPLFLLDNFVGTPHIAPHTVEANYRMGMAAAENIVNFFT